MAVLSLKKIEQSPHGSLSILFSLWKALLLILAFLGPGPGYDTSTDLLFRTSAAQNPDSLTSSISGTLLQHLSLKLVRWDAIYFVSAAKDGYIYEQQWAFGWGFTTLIKKISQLLQLQSSYAEALVAVLIANVAHLLSVLVLYQLVRLLTSASSKHARLPFVAAVLHVISPAGLFLSAPYAESLFSLLSFSSMLAYCKSNQHLSGSKARSLHHDVYVLTSGILLGLAATVRSNALFAGSLYAYDLLALSPSLLPIPRRFSDLRQALCLVIAGLFIVVGFAYPQSIAYKEYCHSAFEETPVWCNAMPPSIYTHVQEHYWNNGFLKYWTLSNLPLFVLGIPMLAIMITSSYATLVASNLTAKIGPAATSSLKRLALPQLIAAFVILTCSHVQIITRLSSGYPLIYIWLASALIDDVEVSETVSQSRKWSEGITKWMVMYAMVQGGLFASFLPPA